MRIWILVVIGAVLPLIGGVTLGSITTDSGEGTWAHPVEPTAFLALSVLLAVSHLLVMLGYLAVASDSRGAGAALARLGAAGLAVLAACEVWSGLLASTALDATVVDILNLGYALASVAVIVGTVGAGFALRGTGSPYAVPLLVIGIFLAIVVPVRFLSDVAGIVGLTVWSLLYIWLALRLRTRLRSSAAAGVLT
jgi:hypothetical protein